MFNVGLNYIFETTKLVGDEKHKSANKLFSETNKYGLYLGAGPSSAFPTNSSSYNIAKYPFLNDYEFPNLFPDLALGYHFTKFDFITGLSFRPMMQTRSAYGFEQSIHRNSLILEAYKFIGDYHGFVPFVGLGVSYENLKVKEVDNANEIANFTDNKVAPAVVFGWDIRPTVKGDWWVLRTNLRYFPTLKIEYQNGSLSQQYLEFNFIQFVFYPQKLAQFKKL